MAKPSLKIVPNVNHVDVAECPLCGGDIHNTDLREYKNIFYCDRGAVALGPVQHSIVRIARRPGGVTLERLADITGSSLDTIKTLVCVLNRGKLKDIGYRIVNVTGQWCRDSLYVLKKVE